MRISDWSSDVCSSDLPCLPINVIDPDRVARDLGFARQRIDFGLHQRERRQQRCPEVELPGGVTGEVEFSALLGERDQPRPCIRSEEHTSELQSLMRISYAVFCLKKKNILYHNISE